MTLLGLLRFLFLMAIAIYFATLISNTVTAKVPVDAAVLINLTL